MNEETSLKFFEKETFSEQAFSGSVSLEHSTEADETSIDFAKVLLGVFGILFVIVVFFGMISEEKGMLTKNERMSADQSLISGPTGAQPNPSNSSYNPHIPPPQPNQISAMSNESGNPEMQSMRALVIQTSEMVRTYALACRQNGGIVQSGFGGQSLCESEAAKSDVRSRILWPTLSICGSAPKDTTWTVFRGDTDTWDITISCASRIECNGPVNALCTKDGCTFSDACLPNQTGNTRALQERKVDS